MAAEKATDPVLWLGRGSTLRELIAEQHRMIELPSSGGLSARALAEVVAAQGIDRFGVVAEGEDAALAVQLGLDLPQTVNALVLLAPTLIDGAGHSGSAAGEALVVLLNTLKPPLLALFGTKDRLAPPEAGRHYRERLASSNVVFVYDAGHTMGEERPEAVAELVDDFLRRHDLFLVRQESDLLYR